MDDMPYPHDKDTSDTYPPQEPEGATWYGTVIAVVFIVTVAIFAVLMQSRQRPDAPNGCGIRAELIKTTEHMYILTKQGTIIAAATAENQCRDVGHINYEYEVKIWTDDKLDSSGFVIDNSLLHAEVFNAFKTMGSCEQLALRSAGNIRALCLAHGVLVYNIEVTIKPINGTITVTYVKHENDDN